ncbi:hypothetical protein BCV72DRAFT_306890 [Rhizopus microsporus var. microsporus]|uniref:Uncharacterized protein n=2 Tax=Rhizopus microsporus TaxID=58291 RepID=A0A2G4T580_RHIZD|nr:uncharacterized protein RHIMIDRAFT_233784 [Rhizopus microsporus ATCC 52813]ORE04921.1 hypothetical protein BCV72DRAFT_306890 [Rhizopus microsporus var. microsporus]PHZ16183.1 hypothetical protein RHIMIDRAFT_233784 [Rhizopus microsporus ATCC 52813]
MLSYKETLFAGLRSTIIEKLNFAGQYSDFACNFSFVVQLAMTTSAMSDVVLLAPIRNPSNNDADYKALFSVNHLQVISTLNFGAVGIQQQTRNNHPLWVNVQELGSGNQWPDVSSITCLSCSQG